MADQFVIVIVPRGDQAKGLRRLCALGGPDTIEYETIRVSHCGDTRPTHIYTSYADAIAAVDGFHGSNGYAYIILPLHEVITTTPVYNLKLGVL